jgi:hypothetical protein
LAFKGSSMAQCGGKASRTRAMFARSAFRSISAQALYMCSGFQFQVFGLQPMKLATAANL